MSDLVAKIRARLDDEERSARAAATGGRWRYSGSDSVGAWTLYDDEWELASLRTHRYGPYDYSQRMPSARHPRYVDADANGRHIAQWDPGRVLAAVEADRRILEICEQDLRQRGADSLDGRVDRPTWDVIEALAQKYLAGT